MNTLKYGISNALTLKLAGKKISEVLASSSFQSALGYGQNVQARINGRITEGDYVIKDNDVVDLETIANRKAADVSVTLRFGPGNQLTRGVPEGTKIKDLVLNPNYKAVLGYGGLTSSRSPAL